MEDLKMNIECVEHKLIERTDNKFNSICKEVEDTYDKLDLAFKKTSRDRSDLEISIK